MDWTFSVSIKRRFILKAHHKTDVERGVGKIALLRQGLADRQGFHFGNFTRKRMRRGDDLLPMLRVARLLEPNQADVPELARRRFPGCCCATSEENGGDECDGNGRNANRGAFVISFHALTLPRRIRCV